MRRGKEVAQGAHASLKNVIENLDHPHVKQWLSDVFTKVVLKVGSEEELDGLIDQARSAGLVANVIIDSGQTEFNGEPTKTAGAIGPGPNEDIDKITGTLGLY